MRRNGCPRWVKSAMSRGSLPVYAAAARGVSAGKQRAGQPPLRLFVSTEPNAPVTGSTIKRSDRCRTTLRRLLLTGGI